MTWYGKIFLTLKAPITTAADDIFFFFFQKKKTSLDISCESSAWQMIHMKCQDLFPLKNKKKIFECCLLQILLSALRVSNNFSYVRFNSNSFRNIFGTRSFKCGKVIGPWSPRWLQQPYIVKTFKRLCLGNYNDIWDKIWQSATRMVALTVYVEKIETASPKWQFNPF